jgi:hypothetical protein
MLHFFALAPLLVCVCDGQMADVSASASAVDLLSSALVAMNAGGAGRGWLGGLKVNDSWSWVDGTNSSNINCSTINCGIFSYWSPECVVLELFIACYLKRSAHDSIWLALRRGKQQFRWQRGPCSAGRHCLGERRPAVIPSRCNLRERVVVHARSQLPVRLPSTGTLRLSATVISVVSGPSQ